MRATFIWNCKMENKYKLFTTNEIKPRGWILRQLRIQAEGLAGNLDKVWPDVRDSMWIGGDREGWERVPYWLDGFIPLAYLLDDEDMKLRAKRYVDKILEFQKPDGWICPNGETPIEEYDSWAVLLISKVLVVYYECSGDIRIPDVIRRIMKNYYNLLSCGKIRLFDWAKYRWYEGFFALNFLRERYPEEQWIKELAKILKSQGTDYEKLAERWIRPLNQWSLDTHIVNLMMMLKSEAVSCELLGERYSDLAERLYKILNKHNGTAVGTFTGDECLAGISPIQGTELCSVVEQMYSYELLYAHTGDKKWAERLERIAFNALPAAISEDMWSHQYCQLVNQIDCSPFNGKPIFRTNSKEAHVFGLEPHFGCCTANFGQGFPKLALSAFMRASDVIISAVPIPSELSVKWKNANVRVTLDTDYPFKSSFVYRISSNKKTNMKLKIRIPTFATNVTVNGEAVNKSGILSLGGFEKGETVIRVSYSVIPKLAARERDTYVVEYGSLVFSHPIKAVTETKEYTKKGVERKFPYCDYVLTPLSDWNYAIYDRELSAEEREVTDTPFSFDCPPIVVTANLCHIDWGYEDGYDTVCAKTPQSRIPLDEARKTELIPYGCAKLRMTQMPMAKKK